MIGLVVMSVMASTGCVYDECKGRDVELELQAVHEWGVFLQVYGDGNRTIAGGPHSGTPPEPIVVEQEDSKPVIYFHGDGIGNVSVLVQTNATGIITIPQAGVSDGDIRWNVTVAGDIEDNDTNAIVRISDEERYEYLFYEGNELHTQDVLAEVERDGDTLTFNVTNIGEYPIQDVYFSYVPAENTEDENDSGGEGGRGGEEGEVEGEVEGGAEGDERSVVIIHIPELNPFENQIIETNVTNLTDTSEVRKSLKGDIVGRGLTKSESEDLLEFWVDGIEDGAGLKAERRFFQSEQNESAGLLYFLLQSEYDRMLPLTVEPVPPMIARVGIVFISGVPVLADY